MIGHLCANTSEEERVPHRKDAVVMPRTPTQRTAKLEICCFKFSSSQFRNGYVFSLLSIIYPIGITLYCCVELWIVGGFLHRCSRILMSNHCNKWSPPALCASEHLTYEFFIWCGSCSLYVAMWHQHRHGKPKREEIPDVVMPFNSSIAINNNMNTNT